MRSSRASREVSRRVRVVVAVLATLLAALLPLPGGIGVPAAGAVTATFPDVPVTHPFFTEIEWLVAEGVTTGYADGTFGPTNDMSRQAMAGFLYRLAGRPPVTAPAAPTFSDVPKSHPFFTEIEWAAGAGITTGYPDGTFKPTRTIARQAMAAMLYRLAGRPAFTSPGSPSFPDVPAAHPFFAEIEWAAANGVVNGYADGTFKATNPVTRQAAAAFLYRYDHFVRPDRWSVPRQISHGVVGDLLSDPTSATGPDGSVHVAWKEDDQVLYRKLDAQGNTLVRTVSLGLAPVQARALAWSDITLVPYTDGRVALLWRYSVGTPQHPGIYGVIIDAAGRLTDTPRLVAAGFYSYLTAAVDAAGLVHLVALENQSSTTVVSATTSSHRIVTWALTPDLRPGGAWSALTGRAANNAANYPKMVVEADGTVHVAWFDSRRFGAATNTYDVFYARSGGSRPPIGPLQLSDKVTGYVVTPDLKGFEVGPAMDVAPDGTVQIAWLNLDDVHLASVSAAGVPVRRGVATDLGNATAKRNDGLVVHAEADGDTTVIVSSGSDDFPTLEQVRLSPTGAFVSAPNQIPVGSGGWTYPSLTTAGGRRQLLVRHGSTSHRLFVLASGPVATNLPDLLVDDAHSTVTSTHTPARATDTVHLTVQVANAGWVGSPATTAEVRHQGTLVATVPVPALGVEGTAAVSADWVVPADNADQLATLTVAVDPTNTVAETTEANNQVDHPVPLLTGPVDDQGLPRRRGAYVNVSAWDETTDKARTQSAGALGVTATLTGTTTAGAPLSLSGTADAISNLVYFPDVVPPGSYVLTGSGPDLVPSGPVNVTVTRDLVDPDLLTVTPTASLVLWFNSWGTVTGTVSQPGGAALAGAKVVEQRQGHETTTDGDGHFSLPDLAAGRHQLTVTAAGFERVLDYPTTVAPAQVSNVQVSMVTATTGYVDVVVTDGMAALSGATVELLDGDDALIATCLADVGGTCSFQPSAGQHRKVRASRAGYITNTTAPFDVVVGGVYPQQLALDLVIGGDTTNDTGDKGWYIGSSYICAGLDLPWLGCTGSEFYKLTGFFGNTIHIEHHLEGTSEVVTSLSTTVTAAPLEFTVLSSSIDIGAPLDFPVVFPTVSEQYTDVRVDDIRIRDRDTGAVVWPVAPLSLAIYSNDGVGSGAWIPNATVSSWSNLVVEVDLKLGKVVFGSTGPDGFAEAPTLHVWGPDRRITWTPSTGTFRNDARFG